MSTRSVSVPDILLTARSGYSDAVSTEPYDIATDDECIGQTIGDSDAYMYGAIGSFDLTLEDGVSTDGDASPETNHPNPVSDDDHCKAAEV